MEDEDKLGSANEVDLKARRKFLKTAAGVAVTAPAVTMLLSPTKSYAGFAAPICIFDIYGQAINGPVGEEGGCIDQD